MNDTETNTAPWLGVHLMAPARDGIPDLERAIREVLAPMGVNVIVLEVGYHFEFESHPEMSSGGDWMTRDDARSLYRACRDNGIRLIPEFNCLGHQSWRHNPSSLLRVHPDMSETPGITPERSMSWCPRHPEVNAIVFDLIDELSYAFGADAFHVGMDEVFYIASEHCPRCAGADPAELFAQAVNDIHDHVVGERGWEMLMWGDRLLDAEETGYTDWEASANGTAPAIDHIPTDIVICDWHYSAQDVYPSLPIFLSRGFRVWPSSWKDAHAGAALIRYSEMHAADERMLGHLCTTWVGRDFVRSLLGQGDADSLDAESVQAAESVRYLMGLMTD